MKKYIIAIESLVTDFSLADSAGTITFLSIVQIITRIYVVH